jgi:hypothetical protein
MRERVTGNEIRAALSAVLLIVVIVLLFVPVTDGAEGIRTGFLVLTGIVVYDFIRSLQEDRRITQIREAYDPTPPPSHVLEREDAELLG